MPEPFIPQKRTVRGRFQKHRNLIRESRHDILNGTSNDHEENVKNGWQDNCRITITATRRKEGSGSVSDADFANFLNTSRRSVFEVANILILLTQHGRIEQGKVENLLKELEEESRMILAFRRSVRP